MIFKVSLLKSCSIGCTKTRRIIVVKWISNLKRIEMKASIHYLFCRLSRRKTSRQEFHSHFQRHPIKSITEDYKPSNTKSSCCFANNKRLRPHSMLVAIISFCHHYDDPSHPVSLKSNVFYNFCFLIMLDQRHDIVNLALL